MGVYLLLFICGVLAGVTRVLFGFGGGFFIVPLLYALLTTMQAAGGGLADAAMHVAVATSTCVMIFTALMATLRQYRAGVLDWNPVRGLLGYIALGAVLGAGAALSVSGQWVRWAFVAYLAATILDSLLRRGFLVHQAHEANPVSPRYDPGIGIGIGMVAAFLGVGGSVMTVPLMRRRGASMTQATAMANPLSLPIAVAGTASYTALAWGHTASLGAGFAGYVDLPACVVLAVGSWTGIRLTSPFIGRIPDRVHAGTYLALLVIMLAVMVVL